jgi:lipocalin
MTFYLFIIGFLLNFISVTGKPVTVSELNIGQYSGRWFQVYGAPTNVIFQGYGECITADYSLLPTGNVSVINSQINKNKQLEQIFGYAYYQNSNEPGQLTVHLDGVPVDSPYWVVKLGEVVNDQYQYSIVTTPSGVSNWVLARNITTFFEKYNSQVTKYLDDNKYSYVPINQDNCIYSNVPVKLSTNIKTECQVATYLKNAGFSQTSLPTMVCISKYESSLNCDAYHKNTDGSSDYGLMQINSYWWCSGDPTSKYNGCSATCNSMYDCQTNSNCAYTVWKQQGYNAWYGYINHKSECDTYKLYC